jgi:hypothetical protein
MKVGSFAPPDVREIPGLPKSGPITVEQSGKLLEARDAATKEVVRALQNNLSFSENFRARIHRISVFHLTEVELSTVDNPTGAVLVRSSLYDYAQLKWRRTDVNKIAVSVSFSTAPTAAATVWLLVF